MSPALAAAVEAKLAELAKNPPKRACVITVRRPGQKAGIAIGVLEERGGHRHPPHTVTDGTSLGGRGKKPV